MNRRGAILAAAAIAAAPLARSAKRVWRIGFLYYGSRASAYDTGRYDVFLRGMRELGHVEDKTYRLEARFADGKVGRLPGLAASLVRAKVDVIVATGGPTVRAAQRATSTIPIVITVTLDPVGEGFAHSLARPGGNITGLSSLSTDLLPKHLELLAACVPGLERAAVLVKPDNPAHAAYLASMLAIAEKLGVGLTPVPASDAAEVKAGIDAMAQERMQGFIIQPETFFVQQVRQIATLATAYRLPSVFLSRDYPAAGGLMSFGPSVNDNIYRAAHFVDQLLKGANPAELPIEQPTRFYLVLNRSAARQIGLRVPRELLLRADEVIG